MCLVSSRIKDYVNLEHKTNILYVFLSSLIVVCRVDAEYRGRLGRSFFEECSELAVSVLCIYFYAS